MKKPSGMPRKVSLLQPLHLTSTDFSKAISVAHKYDRHVAVVGRSMVNVMQVASELGYIHIPEGTLIELDEAARLPKNKVVLITTGSQGEPMSALTRIAMKDHRQVDIMPGDTVIISATPIPRQCEITYSDY